MEILGIIWNRGTVCCKEFGIRMRTVEHTPTHDKHLRVAGHLARHLIKQIAQSAISSVVVAVYPVSRAERSPYRHIR